MTDLISSGKKLVESMLPKRTPQQVVDEFHDLFYNGLPGEGHIFFRTTYMGTLCLKCPMDMWMYQEIIHEVKPDLIIETGTYNGGSALYMAHLLDAIGHGEIVTIDINAERESLRPAHPRIKYVIGSSADPALVDSFMAGRPKGEKIMVILDSDHRRPHVVAEMKLLGDLVPVGSYMIVEDSNVNGHPTYPTYGEGPFEAIEEYMAQYNNGKFEIDKSKERFLMTFNPNGYMKRVK